MTTQILPQTLVFQQAVPVAAAITSPLRAFIFGADYNVQKYNAANKANIEVGQFAGVDATFLYPERDAGDIVDDAFTKVFLENALVNYLSDAVGADDTWAGTATSIRAVATVLKTANGVTRSSGVPVDVAIGDKVKVTKSGSSFLTTVIGLVPEITVAAVPATATPDAGNTGTAQVYVTGPYTGTRDTTYRITVTQSGVPGADVGNSNSYSSETANSQSSLSSAGGEGISFHVSTTNGVDVGDYVLPGDYAAGTPVEIGMFGLSISFGEGTIEEGDAYSVAVEADADGGIQTVLVGDSLPTLYQSGDIQVDFYKVVSVEVPKYHDVTVENWTTTALDVTLDADMEVDLGYGSLPVEAGDVFIEWRGISQRNVGSVKAVASTTDLATLFPGDITPDTGLAYAVSKALANANGTDVRFAAIAADTQAAWLAVLSYVEEKDDVYGFVPLTTDRAIQDLVAAHVEAASGPEQGRWRVAWFGATDDQTAGIVGVDSEINATIVDNPDATGTQFTLVQAAGAGFVTAGVRSGDKLRTSYSLAGSGETTYTEYEVDTVVNNDRLVLLTGPDAEVAVAQKIEVWRNLTSADKTSKLILENSFASKRVRNVFPGHVEAADGAVPAYFMAAALAGLRSGVAPQQGLTNVEIAGFTGVSATVNEFSRTQLDALATAGYWIVTQNVNTGVIYTRKQLTTDTSTIDTAEDSVVAIDDAVSYQYAAVLAKYIGRTNVTDSNIALISADLEAVTAFLKNRGFTASLGGLITDATVESIRKHAVYADRMVCTMNVIRAAPLNNLELYLVFAF